MIVPGSAPPSHWAASLHTVTPPPEFIQRASSTPESPLQPLQPHFFCHHPDVHHHYVGSPLHLSDSIHLSRLLLHPSQLRSLQIEKSRFNFVVKDHHWIWNSSNVELSKRTNIIRHLKSDSFDFLSNPCTTSVSQSWLQVHLMGRQVSKYHTWYNSLLNRSD